MMTDDKARAGRWAALEAAAVAFAAPLAGRYLSAWLALSLAEATALDALLTEVIALGVEWGGYGVAVGWAWWRGYSRVWWAPANKEIAA